jgi:hypothetical protein
MEEVTEKLIDYRGRRLKRQTVDHSVENLAWEMLYAEGLPCP